MIHWGCQHGLPHLDPQADVSTIWSVGPWTSREELRDLYHQVYKLRRLPGSPLCRPEQVHELTRDVVASLKNCLWGRGGKQPRGCKEPEPADTCPSQDRTPQRMRWDILAERELAEAREAHQWVLAAATVLEETIERLSQSTTRCRAGPCAPSQSHSRWRRRSWGQSKRCCRALLEDSQTPSPAYSPPCWGPEVLKDQEVESPYLEFNLGSPPELGPDVEHFFQEQASRQGEDGGSALPKNPRQKIMRGGLNGGDRWLWHPLGGGNCWRFQKSMMSRN